MSGHYQSQLQKSMSKLQDAPMFKQEKRESMFKLGGPSEKPFTEDNLLNFDILDALIHGSGSGVRVPTYTRKFKVSVSSSHARFKTHQFNAKSIVNRPKFYNQAMLDMDLAQRGKEIIDFSTRIKVPKSPSYQNTPICIIRYNQKILGLGKRLSIINAPPSSVKVQWRLTKVNRIPSFQLVFMMLNRVSPVTALIRLNSNSALCVFATVCGANRAVSSWKSEQGHRLLILSWWYPAYELAFARSQVEDTELKTCAWLSKEMRAMKEAATPKLDSLFSGPCGAGSPAVPSFGLLDDVVPFGLELKRKMTKSKSSVNLPGQDDRPT